MMRLYYDKDYDLIVSNGDKTSDWWFFVRGNIIRLDGILDVGEDILLTADKKIAFPLEFMQ